MFILHTNNKFQTSKKKVSETITICGNCMEVGEILEQCVNVWQFAGQEMGAKAQVEDSVFLLDGSFSGEVV